jgi:hypothetical protein
MTIFAVICHRQSDGVFDLKRFMQHTACNGKRFMLIETYFQPVAVCNFYEYISNPVAPYLTQNTTISYFLNRFLAPPFKNGAISRAAAYSCICAVDAGLTLQTAQYTTTYRYGLVTGFMLQI